MTYFACDVNGYIGDVASIGGWRDFRKWANTAQGDEIIRFMINGYTRDPARLAVQLEMANAPIDSVDSTRRNLYELALKADTLLILTDGT